MRHSVALRDRERGYRDRVITRRASGVCVWLTVTVRVLATPVPACVAWLYFTVTLCTVVQYMNIRRSVFSSPRPVWLFSLRVISESKPAAVPSRPDKVLPDKCAPNPATVWSVPCLLVGLHFNIKQYRACHDPGYLSKNVDGTLIAVSGFLMASKYLPELSEITSY